MISFCAPIPILRIFDYRLARAFYADWLGFRIDWEHRFSDDAPRYLQVARGATVLHLSEHYGDCTPGVRLVVIVSDAEGLLAELRSRPNPNMNPGLEMAPWNAKVVEVTDPFGNRLTFTQPLAS
ncbi:MAG: VOC family protein [Planctomycetes bacterium]|nr:VOC family protein [Planctomycetota bacterium]